MSPGVDGGRGVAEGRGEVRGGFRGGVLGVAGY